METEERSAQDAEVHPVNQKRNWKLAASLWFTTIVFLAYSFSGVIPLFVAIFFLVRYARTPKASRVVHFCLAAGLGTFLRVEFVPDSFWNYPLWDNNIGGPWLGACIAALVCLVLSDARLADSEESPAP